MSPFPRRGFSRGQEEARLFTWQVCRILVGILLAETLFGSSVLASNSVSAKEVAELTNQNRISASVKSLKTNPLLEKAANLKARDMARIGYFSHVSPQGQNPWYWLDQAGYSFSYAGENLAVNFFDSKSAVNAWLASPGHRQNILSGKFTETGIGQSVGQYQGRETIYLVQFFAKPATSVENNANLVKSKNVRKTKTIKTN